MPTFTRNMTLCEYEVLIRHAWYTTNYHKVLLSCLNVCKCG